MARIGHDASRHREPPAHVHVLDNPVWNALQSVHAPHAETAGVLVRYPADIAPFVAVAQAGDPMGDAPDALVSRGETVYALGAMPTVPGNWRLHAPLGLTQMVCAAPGEAV